MINIISIIISFVTKNKKLTIIIAIAIAVLLFFSWMSSVMDRIKNASRIEQNNKELTEANVQLYNAFTKLQRRQEATNIIKEDLYKKTIAQEKVIAKQKFYLQDLIGLIHAFKNNNPEKVNHAVNTTFADSVSKLRTSTNPNNTAETRNRAAAAAGSKRTTD